MFRWSLHKNLVGYLGAYALSSAEAEFYAMVEGATRAKEWVNLAHESETVALLPRECRGLVNRLVM